MDLPKRWHPTLLKALYCLDVLLTFTFVYVLGRNERHQSHPLLYVTLAITCLALLVTLYCGNESDRLTRATRKRTTGPCANPECDRQVFFSVGTQQWLHYQSYSTTCAKRLDTLAAPAHLVPSTTS